MATALQKRWIVLVNKSPRGPLSEAEVRTLLAEGVMRHNDLAYCVSVDDPKDKTDWKLLWQFDEFNRRGSEAEDKKMVAEPVEEKRSDLPSAEIQKLQLSELPEDLMNIAPEDLIVRTRSLTMGSRENRMADVAVEADDQNSWQNSRAGESTGDGQGRHFEIPRWAYAFVTVCLVSFGLFHWIASKPFSSASLLPPPIVPESSSHGDARGTASSPAASTFQRSSPIRRGGASVNEPPAALPVERPPEESAAERELDREKERDRERDRDGESNSEEADGSDKASSPSSSPSEDSDDGRNPASKKARLKSRDGDAPDERREEETPPPEDRREND